MPRFAPLARRPLALALGIVLALSFTLVASANVGLTQISSDPFTNSSSQHATQVEPDSFAYGNTIVGAFQSGRFTDGGSSDIGWATSTDSGATWTNGFLPGVTIYSTPPGPYARVSDPAVGYDAKHNVWIISSLPLDASVNGAGAIVNRSTDGGLNWGNAIVVSSESGTDKDWIACDNTVTSPFYGNCYVEWDRNSTGNTIKMSTSSDGGLTWGPTRTTANNATGLGGQQVVQPNGTVIVPIEGSSQIAFRSTDGGATWTSPVTISSIKSHGTAGGLRAGSLPSAEIDGAGKVYVVWSDCRFERRCKANDIVMSTSTDGVTWAAPVRIPTEAVGSNVDHFIPGIAVDKSTSGSTAHVALAYYYYPVANCTSSTCQLQVGYISSTNGGTSWSAATQLAGPMFLSWIANTTQGRMVGDYMSTSIAGGRAYPVFANATAPSGSTFNEAMFVPTGGLTVAGGPHAAQALPELAESSDQPLSFTPLTAR